MKDTQQIYYTEKNKKYVFYLVNNREKRYCIIPKEYYGLCIHLYGCQLDCFDYTIEDKCKGYDLTSLEEVNG